MIKRISFLILSLLLCMNMSGQKRQYKYVDAADLTIIGKVLPTPEPYTRIDTAVYKFEDKVAMRYANYSTGLAVVFRTDSRNINVKWQTSSANAGANMTAILQKGLDLYIKSDGEWVFAGVGSPKMVRAPYDTHESQVVGNMAEGMKECLMYLPIFDKVDKMEIGVDEGSVIEAIDNPFSHKIIFKGSSITHGASASRPGMTYPARFGRDNGFYVCNMGFSGRSKLQKEYAYILAASEADAFVFDAFSNPPGTVIHECFDEFVDIIRAAHPYAPMIFLQTERRETRNFNQRSEEIESAKQKAGEAVVRERMKTDKHMYFIDSEGFLGDEHIGTVDGTHPNDIGFTHMLDCITPKILTILEKYGITPDSPEKSDSLAFVNAEWEIEDLGKGAQSMYAQVPMFDSMQSICVVKYPVKNFKTEILHRPKELAGKPSEIGKEIGATFAINGGFFHVKQKIPAVYYREGKEQLGYTHPTELYRIDGIMGFKDRRGRNAVIEAAPDTLCYDAVSEGWHSAMASGPLLLLDGEIAVPEIMGDKVDGANVAAMKQEQKSGAKIRTHYTSAQFYDKRHPRAAFGTDNVGNAYLIAVDGRFKDRADGASIYELAYICHLLGMTDAINLDGGGSTTLWTEKTGVINHPYDNKKFDHEGERSVPNLIVVY